MVPFGAFTLFSLLALSEGKRSARSEASGGKLWAVRATQQGGGALQLSMSRCVWDAAKLKALCGSYRGAAFGPDDAAFFVRPPQTQKIRGLSRVLTIQ